MNKDIYEVNAQCINMAKWAADSFRQQNMEQGLHYIKWIFGAFQDTVETLAVMRDCPVKIDRIAGSLKLLYSAQSAKDYLALADLMDEVFRPILLETQKYLTEKGLRPAQESVENKLAQIEEWDPQLAKLVREHTLDESGKYTIEITPGGYETLKIRDQDGEYYLHSRIDPDDEARLLAYRYVDENTKRYIIYGAGLMYHVSWIECFSRLFFGAVERVDVYESDINIILLMLLRQTRNNIPYLKSSHIYVHYDPDFTGILDALRETPEGLVVHYPSLRNIKSRDMRNKFMNYFIQDNSRRNARSNMKVNFNCNTENIHRCVDELEDKFTGKDVYIIAAGPSLDKNLKLLEKKPQNSLILAVGTVYNKLVNLKIEPDFIIVLDAKDSIWNQFYAQKDSGRPVIVASTACGRIATNYNGPLYLACQEGYGPAEEYAAEKNYRLYQTGGSVSTIAMDIAVGLRAARVIFLGLDLAYTDDLAHAGDTSGQLASDRSDLFPVEDYGRQGVVYSDNKFDIYRRWFVKRIKKLRADGVSTPIINATEGGGYIEGMEHITLSEVLGGAEERL